MGHDCIGRFSGMCVHKCSHRLYWTRQEWSTGWWPRLPLAGPRQPSPAQRSCRTSGWTSAAGVKGRVCESTLHGVWPSSTTGDHHRPLLLSKWGSNIEQSVRLLTRPKDSRSIRLRFQAKWQTRKENNKIYGGWIDLQSGCAFDTYSGQESTKNASEFWPLHCTQICNAYTADIYRLIFSTTTHTSDMNDLLEIKKIFILLKTDLTSDHLRVWFRINTFSQ